MVPISDDPHRFAPGAVLQHEDGRELTVSAARDHSGRLLVSFAGVSTRDDAESLRGALYVAAEAARDLGEEEFWPHDLEGCEVFTAHGTRVGVVARVIVRPAQDLLAIETDAGERLVPFVAPIVTEVDLEGRRVTLEPPEGLLD